ncbi:MAG: hypothetical protein GXP55_24315 [Deltaproteobacteria bacterium]|nr:hypothetical protein [Deltaproteobacteria bacterium]
MIDDNYFFLSTTTISADCRRLVEGASQIREAVEPDADLPGVLWTHTPGPARVGHSRPAHCT